MRQALGINYAAGDPRRALATIYAAALEAAAPERVVGAALDGALAGAGELPELFRQASGLHMLAVGKAAFGMAEELDRRFAGKIRSGLIVAPKAAREQGGEPRCGAADAPADPLSGQARGLPAGWRLIRASHPLPDAASVQAARLALEMAERARPDERLVVALSGGASALMAMPAEGLSLADKIAVAAALLRSGATINEFNAVRKHLSAVKGGRLLQRTRAGRVVGLILSDVPGNDLATVGSGPTVADPTTFAEAVAVLRRRGLWGRTPEVVRAHLEKGLAGQLAETLKPGEPAEARARNLLVGDNATAVAGAAACAEAMGFSVERWGELAGEADGLGRALAAHLCAPGGERKCVVAGGEPSVTVQGDGRGGRAQQCALAMAVELSRIAGSPRVAALFAGTDGIDGPTDAAGGFALADSAARARAKGLDPERALARNDAYPLLAALGDLLVTGPSGTNVGDLFIGIVNY